MSYIFVKSMLGNLCYNDVLQFDGYPRVTKNSSLEITKHIHERIKLARISAVETQADLATVLEKNRVAISDI